MVTRLTPKASATSQSVRDRPPNRGLARITNTTVDVASRSQTIAVGGTIWNRCLAIAAPNWTEKIPATTSQTAGILLSGPGRVGNGAGDTTTLCQRDRTVGRPPTQCCAGARREEAARLGARIRAMRSDDVRPVTLNPHHLGDAAQRRGGTVASRPTSGRCGAKTEVASPAAVPA